MKIICQIGASWTRNEVEILEDYGISVEINKFSYVILEASIFNQIRPILESELIFSFGTEFTIQERQKSEFSVFNNVWEHGYPYPSDNFGFLENTYDLTDYCSLCGGKAIQKTNFTIGKEPKWGKKLLLQLTWVYDVLFAQVDFYKECLEPLGISCRDVLVGRKKEIAKTIVQLDLPTCISKLDTSNLQGDVCNSCYEVRYSPEFKGLFPKFNGKEKEGIFLTKETFGVGKLNYKRIIVSKKIRSVLIEKKASKLSDFVPIEEF